MLLSMMLDGLMGIIYLLCLTAERVKECRYMGSREVQIQRDILASRTGGYGVSRLIVKDGEDERGAGNWDSNHSE